jgi:hypothetical protein
MFQTYSFVKSNPGCTAPQLHAEFDRDGMFHSTAFNNRLEILRTLGLVRRDRQGVKWLYRTI